MRKIEESTIFLVVVLAAMLMLNACSGDNATREEKYNGSVNDSTVAFVVVDTGLTECYDAHTTINCYDSFPKQDAEYIGNAPDYTDHGDQTITDNNTGLMWSAVTINDVEFADATAVADASMHAGYTDWRVPTIKELYSLIDFSGSTGLSATNAVPYIDTRYFDHAYFSTGSRYIDAQYLSATAYVGAIFDGQLAFFGVNFADGRIKGYPQQSLGLKSAGWNLRLVRGDAVFTNAFIDNGDNTITDNATGLIWLQQDSGWFSGSAGTQGDGRMDWQEALEWCENLDHAGKTDWRLPNAKELQSIVDYSRAPAVTGSAAIDPLFQISTILDPEGDLQYPYFWTSTIHLDGATPGNYAVYIAFDKAQGRMNAQTRLTGSNEPLLDVHGAGAQRSDPKSGDIHDYPQYHGPQGDVLYVYNYARCVRSG